MKSIEEQINESLVACVTSKQPDIPNQLRHLLDLRRSEDSSTRISVDLLARLVFEVVEKSDWQLLQIILEHTKPSKHDMNEVLNRQFSHLAQPLETAAINKDLKTLELLLKFGVDPNTKIVNRNITVLSFVCGNYDGFDTREPDADLERVVDFFLQYGSDLSLASKYEFAQYLRLGAPDENSEFPAIFQPIHLIGELAKRSPGASLKILDRSKIDLLNNPRLVAVGTCGFGHIGSPLTISIIHGLVEESVHYDTILNHTYSESADDGEILDEHAEYHFKSLIKRVFTGSVVPLIKSGAVMVPDPMVGHSNRYWHEIAIADEILNFQNFNLLDLISSVRLDNCLPLIKDEEKTDYLREKLNTIFPLNLQKMCRIAITKLLPKGIKNRSRAVEMLRLPINLEQFLLYSEFTL